MSIESLLLENLSKEQLEEQLAEKIASFHGLLTREIALKLIAKEKGLLKEEEKKTKIKDIESGSRKLIIQAKIKKIWPIANYRSGKRSRVIEINDNTGAMPLVLWNDDIALTKMLHTKDFIQIKGIYEKNEELHLGYAGVIELLEKAEFNDLANLPNDEYVHVKGKVCRIDGYDRFVDGSTSKPAFSFFITDEKKKVQVLIWKKTERGAGLKLNDEIILESALTKNNRLELSEDARILRRRKKELLIGKIKKINGNDKQMKVVVGDKEVELDRLNALRFMGLDIADDIDLTTIITLKKDFLLDSNIALKIKEEGTKITIQK